MALKMSYCTLRWKNPDLEPALETLKEAGWAGWEGRLPLDWLGPPGRVRRICENTGMPMVVFTSSGSPELEGWEHVERNKRRMEYAAAMEVDCFMFMSGPKPKDRPVNEDDIKVAAERAETWAEYAAQYDLEVSYHIHTNTLIDSTEHWRRYTSLLERTKLCIDVSHAALWGYDPVQAIHDLSDRLNYIHLQDYSSTSRATDGRYLPVWCDVGEAESLDFGAVLNALEEIGFARWVTTCPGKPKPGQGDASSEARRSRRMRAYLEHLGY